MLTPPKRNSELRIAYAAHPEEHFRMALHEWGDAANPQVVFCVHGLTRNAMDFSYLAEKLAADFRVIAVDMPGRGGSEWLKYKEEYNYASYLAYINQLFVQLQLGAVHWVGTSMGGIIGMMLAAQAPQRIKSLLLNDIGSFVGAGALQRIGAYVGKRMEFATRAEAEAALREIYAPFGLETESEWRHLLEHDLKDIPGGGAVRNYDPAIAAPFADVSKITDVDLSAFWMAIQCPVMVVRGAQSDLLSAETLAAMRTSRPGITVLEVPNAGHAPALMNDAQAGPVVAWLKEKSR